MKIFDPLKTPPQVALANFYPFQSGEVAGPHWSASDLFLPCTDGQGEIDVGPRAFPLQRGQMLHVPWAAPIRYRADVRKPFVLIGVHLIYLRWSQHATPPLHTALARDFSRAAMQAPPVPQPFDGPFVFTVPHDSNLLDLGTAIARAYEKFGVKRRDDDRDALLRALALQFVLELRRCRHSPHQTTSHPQAGVVRELISFMELAHGKPFRRTELAQRAGLSESALAAAFRAVTGRAPIDYLIELRLAHARNLLSTSRQRITDVARAVGIPDVYYFSKLFKRRNGLSPLQFRKQRRL